MLQRNYRNKKNMVMTNRNKAKRHIRFAGVDVMKPPCTCGEPECIECGRSRPKDSSQRDQTSQFPTSNQFTFNSKKKLTKPLPMPYQPPSESCVCGDPECTACAESSDTSSDLYARRPEDVEREWSSPASYDYLSYDAPEDYSSVSTPHYARNTQCDLQRMMHVGSLRFMDSTNADCRLYAERESCETNRYFYHALVTGFRLRQYHAINIEATKYRNGEIISFAGRQCQLILNE